MKLITGKERWFVAMTFTGDELAVADDLRKAGFQGYVPKYRVQNLVRRRRIIRETEKPLLPSYVFVAMPDNPNHRHFGKITDIDGVIGFLKNQGEPVEIDSEIVVELEVREMNGEFDIMLTDDTRDRKEKAKAKFPVGSKAELTAGTFAMMIGTVLKHEKTGRIKLEVDVFGKAFVVDVGPENMKSAA